MSEAIINGVYCHYKNPDMLYVVTDIARHTESNELLVVYRSLYGDRELWARPLEMFCGEVNIKGIRRERFTHLGPYDENRFSVSNDIKSTINICFPEEIQHDILSYDIDVERELLKEVPDAQFEYVSESSQKGEKSGILTVIVCFAGASLVLFAIERIVRTIMNRPQSLSITEKDDDGNVLRKMEYKVGSELPRRILTDIKVGKALEIHFKDIEN